MGTCVLDDTWREILLDHGTGLHLNHPGGPRGFHLCAGAACQHHLLELSQAGAGQGWDPALPALAQPGAGSHSTNPGAVALPLFDNQPWLLLSFTNLGSSQ